MFLHGVMPPDLGERDGGNCNPKNVRHIESYSKLFPVKKLKGCPSGIRLSWKNGESLRAEELSLHTTRSR